MNFHENSYILHFVHKNLKKKKKKTYKNDLQYALFELKDTQNINVVTEFICIEYYFR